MLDRVNYWRAYCFASLIVVIYEVFQIVHGFFTGMLKPSIFDPIIFALVMPAMLCGFLSVYVFHWLYSRLGRTPRTQAPSEGIIFEMRSWIQVDRFHCSAFAKWMVFESGLGIWIPFLGTCFVPVASLLSIQQRWKCCEIRHVWPELRSPIVCPCEVGEHVARIIEATKRNGDLYAEHCPSPTTDDCKRNANYS